ncbi:hypothetical protein NBRC116593_28740 [Sulfitobacter pacificus]
MEWQPIETAPKDGTEILAYSCGDIFTATYLKSNVSNDAPFFATTAAGEPWDCSGTTYRVEHEYRRGITHWMPLPNPPKHPDHADTPL